jgi:hypothetical protein
VPVIICPNCAAKYQIGRNLIGCLLPCAHCGIEWRAINERTSIWRSPVIIVLLIASALVFLFMFLVASDGHGSAAGAAHLRTLVEPIADPESGQGSDPEYGCKRFSNGEWVLGISRDSHGLLCRFYGGGTVVFKDSRGQIRCFFGHICGPGGHRSLMFEPQSLDELYDKLVKYYRFTEYHWPR